MVLMVRLANWQFRFPLETVLFSSSMNICPSLTLTQIIGVLDPALSSWFNFWGFHWLKTMIYMLKINEKKDILPSVTLGY
ncbi:Extracellular calcium-sensing receptor [Manis javanica]|nr:Extracellular calcium-sensing receptor [Manis javanica]